MENVDGNVPASLSPDDGWQSNRIFDRFRRKWVPNTPEERVRQAFLTYLSGTLGYPAGLIAVEHAIRLGTKVFRCDAVVFSTTGLPLLIVECKAPVVPLSGKVIDQISVYNLRLHVKWLAITNGTDHRYFEVDFVNRTLLPLNHLPPFTQLNL